MKRDEVVSLATAGCSSSLQRSLASVCKFSYYSGILLDWCHVSHPKRRNRAVVVIHHTTIALFFLINIFNLLIEFLELTFAIQDGSSLGQLLPRVILFGGRPCISGTFVIFILHRKRFLRYFQDWSKVESTILKNQSIDIASDRVYFILKIVHLFSCGAIVVGYTMIIFMGDSGNDNNGTTTIGVKDLFRRFMTPLGYNLIEVINIYSSVVLFAMNDLVPSFVYHHTAKLVRMLQKEICEACHHKRKASNDLQIMILDIWIRYDEVSHLISRANSDFGPLVVINHGLVVFDLCCASVILFYQSNTSGIAFYLPVVLICFGRMVWSVGLIGKVSEADAQTLSAVTTLHSREWPSMNRDERSVLRAFLNQLQQSRLTASPCQFYDVTPSLLLAVISLVVTYTIFLLQSAH